MYQCILNVPLWNGWIKVIFSQLHGSPVLNTLLFKTLNWISATIFAELIQFGQNPKLTTPRTFWRERSVFHWRKISYLNFTYIFPLFLLFISYLHICILYIYIYIYIYNIYIFIYFKFLAYIGCFALFTKIKKEYGSSF